MFSIPFFVLLFYFWIKTSNVHFFFGSDIFLIAYADWKFKYLNHNNDSLVCIIIVFPFVFRILSGPFTIITSTKAHASCLRVTYLLHSLNQVRYKLSTTSAFNTGGQTLLTVLCYLRYYVLSQLHHQLLRYYHRLKIVMKPSACSCQSTKTHLVIPLI